MPVYSMRNIETSDEFEVNIKYSDLQEYLTANPNTIQIFTKFPGYCDPVRIGATKIPNAFRDVLAKAKNAHLRSTIEF